MSAHPAINDHSWWGMIDAPKDGTTIEVQVLGAVNYATTAMLHKFPYPVCWYQGKWCFAKNLAPLYPWQEPRRWRPIET